MKKNKSVKTVGIVAPSFVVPEIELELGAERLRSEGFQVHVHPQCYLREGFLAGSDEARARAFLEFARDPEIDVIWFARGGYGAARLLPWLSRVKNLPKNLQRKMLVGYSDATVLLNFVQQKWGWRAVHAMMPGGKEFLKVHGEAWEETLRLVKSDTHNSKKARFSSHILSQFKKWDLDLKSGEPVTRALSGSEKKFLASSKTHYVGGNIAVLSSLAGTPGFPRVRRGSVIFLEDITETPYRIDRMLNQLRQAGFFKNASAVLLGTFTKCADSVPSVWTKRPQGDLQMILRAVQTQETPFAECQGSLRETLDFNESLCESLRFLWGASKKSERIPVYLGAPSGHGGGTWPIEFATS